MTEAYLQLDKELLEGKEQKTGCREIESKIDLMSICYHNTDQNFSYDPSGCTAVSALLMPSQKSIFVASIL